MYFNSAASTDRPKDVIPLGSLIAVRKESHEESLKNNRLSSVERTASDRARSQPGAKNIQLSPSEKPGGAWIHVLEFETHKRCYRLFSDNYAIKEQWFFALNQIVLHKEYLDLKHKAEIQKKLRAGS